MTAPNQTADLALGNDPTLAGILGPGAFTVSSTSQNWGQNYTKEMVQGLISGPATSLGAAFTDIASMLSAIETYLGGLPLEVLQQIQPFIPGKTLEADFDTVANAVNTIKTALNMGSMSVKLSDFTGWLSATYHILETEVHQFLDVIKGLVVTPITTRISDAVTWWNGLVGQVQHLDSSGNLPQSAVTGLVAQLSSMGTDITTALANGAQGLKDLLTGITSATNADVTNWMNGLLPLHIFNARTNAGSNLVISPDFEDPTIFRSFGSYPGPDAVGIAAGGAADVSYSTDVALSGTHSMKMHIHGVTGGGFSGTNSEGWLWLLPNVGDLEHEPAIPTSAIKVRPGQVFYMEVSVYGATSNTQPNHMALSGQLWDSTGVNAVTAVDAQAISGYTTTGAWTTMSGYVTVPAGYDLMAPFADANNYGGSAGDSTFYWDNAVVREVTEAQKIIQQLYGGSGILSAIADTNIPALAQSKITGLVSKIQHLNASTGFYDAATGFDNAATSILRNLDSTGQFDAAKLFNLSNIGAIAQSKVTGLVNTIQHLDGSTGLYDAAQGFTNQATSVLRNLDGTGQFDAAKLINLTNIGAIAQSKITNLTTDLGTINTNISTNAGNISAMISGVGGTVATDVSNAINNALPKSLWQASTVAGKNLVISPQFEDNTITREFFSSGSGSGAYTTAVARSGTQCYAITTDASGGFEYDGVWLSPNTLGGGGARTPAAAVKVQPGQWIYGECYVRAKATNTATAGVIAISLIARDSTGVNAEINVAFAQTPVSGLSSSAWTKLSGWYQIPAGYDQMWPLVWTNSLNVGSQVFYVDDVRVIEDTHAHSITQQLFGGDTILPALSTGLTISGKPLSSMFNGSGVIGSAINGALTTGATVPASLLTDGAIAAGTAITGITRDMSAHVQTFMDNLNQAFNPNAHIDAGTTAPGDILAIASAIPQQNIEAPNQMGSGSITMEASAQGAVNQATGSSLTATTTSFTVTNANFAIAKVTFMSNANQGLNVLDRSVTIGGKSATRLKSVGDTGTELFSELWYVQNPTKGSGQTASAWVSSSTGLALVQAVEITVETFTGVGSYGLIDSTSGSASTALSHTAPSAVGNWVVQHFSMEKIGSLTISTAYNKTLRGSLLSESATSNSGNYYQYGGDSGGAATGSTTAFTATTSATCNWYSISVNLIPQPTTPMGVGASMWRTSTTTVSLSTSTTGAVLPTSFFSGGSLNGKSPDGTTGITIDTTNGAFTVVNDGYYNISLSVFISAIGSNNFVPILMKGGVPLRWGNPNAVGLTSQAHWTVPLKAGDTVTAGYRVNTTGCSLAGEATGAQTVFEIALSNRGNIS